MLIMHLGILYALGFYAESRLFVRMAVDMESSSWEKGDTIYCLICSIFWPGFMPLSILVVYGGDIMKWCCAPFKSFVINSIFPFARWHSEAVREKSDFR